MQKKTIHSLARQQLDKQLKALRPLAKYEKPIQGWIRVIRQALGMTTQQLADRMGTSRARISFLEKEETSHSLTLKTLNRAAAGLGCKVVYFLVPEEPLQTMVEKQADKAAQKIAAPVVHTMALENQSLDQEDQRDFYTLHAKELLSSRPNKIWD